MCDRLIVTVLMIAYFILWMPQYHREIHAFTTVSHCGWRVGTVENHRKHDFRQMSQFCQNVPFCRVLALMLWFCIFTRIFFVFNEHMFKLITWFSVSTQKYLFLPLLSKFLRYFFLSMWAWHHRRNMFLMLRSDKISQTKTFCCM